MKKSTIIILNVGLLIFACKPTQETLNVSLGTATDKQIEQYRVINTWPSRNTAFYPTTLTNYFQRGPLEEFITAENLSNTDYYINSQGEVGTKRMLGAAKISEFKQKIILLRYVQLRQDLTDGLVTAEPRNDKHHVRITFPIVSDDGLYAIAYKEDALSGSIYLFKKNKGEWEIFGAHNIFSTPTLE